MRHVQLPNNMTTKDLTPKDLLVYVSIKRYMNKDSLECYPSLDKIVEVSGISKPTVRKTIDKLSKLNYITVTKSGRKNIYKFSPYKNFEPFSYEFLDKKRGLRTQSSFIISMLESLFFHKFSSVYTFSVFYSDDIKTSR